MFITLSKNYFQYWEGSEVEQGPSSFYLPTPKENPIFSLFPQAFAQEPEPVSSDPDEAPVGAALVGEEFLTTPENLATLDDELEELADEELDENIEIPETPPPGGTPPVGGLGGPIGGTSPEGARPIGQSNAIFQTSCGQVGRANSSSSWIFISNFLIGLLLTIFRRRK